MDGDRHCYAGDDAALAASTTAFGEPASAVQTSTTDGRDVGISVTKRHSSDSNAQVGMDVHTVAKMRRAEAIDSRAVAMGANDSAAVARLVAAARSVRTMPSQGRNKGIGRASDRSDIVAARLGVEMVGGAPWPA